MVSSSGQLVDLSSICPSPVPVQSPSTSTTTASQPVRLTDGDISGLIGTYANRYCDLREGGGVSRDQAEDAANSEMIEIAVTVFGMDAVNEFTTNQMDSSFFDRVEQQIQHQCSNDA